MDATTRAQEIEERITRDFEREPSLSLRSLPAPVSPRREWFGAAYQCQDCDGINECHCCDGCGKAPDACECRGLDHGDSIETLGLRGVL